MWPRVGFFWPGNHVETLDEFKRVFSMYGYTYCGNALQPGTEQLEAGYEKIALYVKGTDITHVARQLPDGTWTSKLGVEIDISHDAPNDLPQDGPLSCVGLGVAYFFFKRRIGFVLSLKARLLNILMIMLGRTSASIRPR